MPSYFRREILAGIPFAYLVTLALLATACSRTGEGTAQGAQRQPANKSSTAALSVGNACDRKLLSKADVAGLLSEPIESVETLQGDAQSCVFTSKGLSTVTVALRPGLGDVTVSTLASGNGNQSVTSLPGVGDKAVWNDVLKEVNATKANVLCDVGVVGPASRPATAEKVGAVCNKLFAAS